MRYLLDTHVLLWWLNGDVTLSKKVREIIANPDNIIFISSVSTWEFAIKKSLGKLIAPDDLEKAIEANEFQKLPITIKHTIFIENLPAYHDDPFGRLLIAQAIIEGLTLLTRDAQIPKYQVHTIKA
ncbi:type II toxin-antitoxin system VapC family toxin [Rickettsia endosymbiont of Polydrusus tereticollis]|uniref:type II toxin-antitoxin system VapC family toxin n=1 Tax=Rickettsia endosymbiont of Polydrusus tereticollis TaxID=3066251 RepID=UPI003132DEFD